MSNHLKILAYNSPITDAIVIDLMINGNICYVGFADLYDITSDRLAMSLDETLSDLSNRAKLLLLIKKYDNLSIDIVDLRSIFYYTRMMSMLLKIILKHQIESISYEYIGNSA